MPMLNKIIAGLALSTAVIGGAMALGATAASADLGRDNNGVADGNRGGTGGIAQDNTGLGNFGFFPGFNSGNDEGVANGNRGGTGGIAQGNNGTPAFFNQTVPFNNFGFGPGGNCSNGNCGGGGLGNGLNEGGNNGNLNNLNNNWGDNSWWNQQDFWNQGLYKDARDDHSAFGVVAKDVALGFQDKTNRDNNWFNNHWLNNNNWWNVRDQLHNNRFNNNLR